MGARRRSRSDLPHAPLELLHPLLLPGAEVPGREIVRELANGHAATLLLLLRAVLAWSAHPEGTSALDAAALERAERTLLARGPDALASPAGLLAGYMARPGNASAREVAWACICVSDWAAEQGARATAVLFAQAAALAWPRHARYAWLVARMLRAEGRVRESESWFRRAHRVAVWTADGEAQARTLAGLGNLSYATGNYARADVRLGRALKITRRFNLPVLEGETLHDLFVVSIMRGDQRRAEALGMQALERYLKARHPRLPNLVFDFAVMWSNSGYFRRALPLLAELRSQFTDPSAQLQVFAAAARAAGACGEVGPFEENWALAHTVKPEARSASVFAACLVDLGLGASSLSKWTEAREILAEALQIARDRNEGDVVLHAESLLDAVGSHERAEARVPLVNASDDGKPNPLVRALVHALRDPDLATSPV